MTRAEPDRIGQLRYALRASLRAYPRRSADKMKMIIIFMALLPYSLLAENLFREVEVLKDTWEVVFHSDGIRYRIEIDGSDRGISEYLQRLELKNNERLKLTEKHQSIMVTCAKSKEGLDISMTYRGLKSGELKTFTSFEPNHGAEPVERVE